ncbi:MAG TPA: hypothetical protein VLH10_13980 [Yinghuangia sp.]|nr:hypothetical protein [Yinghuangia sp.]
MRDFRYEAVDDHTAGADLPARPDWLTRNTDGHTPQPYERLALAYRAAGRTDDARAVAGQIRRRAVLGNWSRMGNSAQQRTVGYGYRPRLAGIWIAAFLACGRCSRPVHRLRRAGRGGRRGVPSAPGLTCS